jgi:hypothetical protein
MSTTRQPAVPKQTRRRILGVGAGAGILGGQGLAGYLHPALGEVLAATDVIIPLVMTLILFIAIMCGNSQTCERAFRLLRWIANRPEPPAPDQADQSAA